MITLGDLDTNSDVEYRTLVCGKYVSQSPANFGIHLSQNTLEPSLEFLSTVASQSYTNVNVGSVISASGTVLQQSAVQYTLNGRPFNINGGNNGSTLQIDSSLAEKCSKVTRDVQGFSQYLSQLTPNNDVTVPTDQPGPLNFIVNNVYPDGLAIFSLSCNEVLNNQKVQQIKVRNDANARMVVINLSGRSCSYQQGNMVGSWLNGLEGRSKTIWNVYEQPLDDNTPMSIDRNLMGALVAPYYRVQTSSNIDGSAAVYQMVARAELHKPGLVFPPCVESQSTTPAFDITPFRFQLFTETPILETDIPPTTPSMSYCEETNGMNQPLTIQPDQVTYNPTPENPSPSGDINPTPSTPGLNFPLSNPDIQVTLTQPTILTLVYVPTNRNDLPTTVEQFTVTLALPNGTTLGPYPSEIPSTSAPSQTTTSSSNVVSPSAGSPQVPISVNSELPQGTILIIDVTKTKDDSSATGVCIIFLANPIKNA